MSSKQFSYCPDCGYSKEHPTRKGALVAIDKHNKLCGNKGKFDTTLRVGRYIKSRG